MPIAPVVTIIRNLTLGSTCPRFVKSTREDYSGAQQSVGLAIILRRTGPMIILLEKLADLRKQTEVDLKNLKKITRNTPKKYKKIIPSSWNIAFRIGSSHAYQQHSQYFLVCIA